MKNDEYWMHLTRETTKAWKAHQKRLAGLEVGSPAHMEMFEQVVQSAIRNVSCELENSLRIRLSRSLNKLATKVWTGATARDAEM